MSIRSDAPDWCRPSRGPGTFRWWSAAPRKRRGPWRSRGSTPPLVVLTAPGLDQTHLREALAPGEPVEPEPLDDVERRHIARTLTFTRGNKRRAAHLLGIARSTLLAKVRKYGLDGGAEGSTEE